jgi:type I restriction enzyme M protein
MADIHEHRITFQPTDEKALSEVGSSYTYFEDGDVLLAKVTPCFENGKAGIARGLVNGIGFGSSEFYVLRPSPQVLPEWIYFCVMHPLFREAAIAQMTGTGGLQRVPRSLVENFQIPLPPLEVQREIVAEIEGYQKVIQGARAVLENYRPHIPIQPDWPMEVFGNVTSTITPPAKINAGDFRKTGRYPVIDQSQDAIAGRTDDEGTLVDGTDGLVIFGDHTCAVKFVQEPFAQGADGIKIIRPAKEIEPKFAYYYLLSYPIRQDGYKRHFAKLKESSIAVPPLSTQRAIVAEIEAEQALVGANRELITRFEKKIQATLARIWGDGATSP